MFWTLIYQLENQKKIRFLSSEYILDCVFNKYRYNHLIQHKKELLKNTIGKNNTVWGIQKNEELNVLDVNSTNLHLSIIFYTHTEICKNDHTNLWNNVRQTLKPNMLSFDLDKNIPVDYPVGMFSIDLPTDSKKNVSSVDTYFIEPGKGILYKMGF